MQLKISHVTEYAYAQPVRYALQRLRLTPQNSPLQTVHSWNTEVEGGTVEASYVDHFGNVVELVSASRDTEAIKVVASGLVETYDKIGVSGPHKAYMPLWLYQRDSALTKPGKLIRELARSIEKGKPLDQLHGLKTALHQAMAYVPGATQTQTLAEDALGFRKRGLPGSRPGLCRSCPRDGVPGTIRVGLPDDGGHARPGCKPRMGGSPCRRARLGRLRSGKRHLAR
jgi:transglutaminase-like putative cysteine protease